jgi:murein DD-endopeptidase MepM/ murein hydrolase activator NlpD
MWNMGPDLAPSAMGANDMIVAPEEGTIIGIQKNDDLDHDQLSEADPNGGNKIDNAYGNSVLIRGKDNVIHRLSHLADLQNLQLGQQVSAGDALGHIGSTGFATGTHLDWETWAQISMLNTMTGATKPGYQLLNPIEWYQHNQWQFAPFRQWQPGGPGTPYQSDPLRATDVSNLPPGATVITAKDLNNVAINPGDKVTAGGGGGDNSSPHQLQIVIRLEQGSDGKIIGTIGGPDAYLLAFNNQDPLAGKFPGAYSGPPVFAVSPTVVP